MKKERITYQAGKVKAQGYLAYKEEGKEKRPGVVIAHAWRGQDHFARHQAEHLAEMGIVAFAADLYGDGKQAKDNDEAALLMAPLFTDRKELRIRIRAALDELSKHPLVDKTRLGAIGFCFGGLTVLELFRSGAPVEGVVCFHAVLGDKMGPLQAQKQPIADNIRGSIMILHGHQDPLVSDADIKHLQKELTDAKVDWQMHFYGHTQHAFTNPEANDLSLGLVFNALAERRAFQAMRDFFHEKLFRIYQEV